MLRYNLTMVALAGLAMAEECRLARRLGFVAKMAIHPRQLAAIHAAFTPTPEEVAYSRGLLEAFEEARASGTGVFRYRGDMVDKANVRRAENVLARDLSGTSGAPTPHVSDNSRERRP